MSFLEVHAHMWILALDEVRDVYAMSPMSCAVLSYSACMPRTETRIRAAFPAGTFTGSSKMYTTPQDSAYYPVRHTDLALKALIGFFVPQGMLGLVVSSPEAGLGPAHIHPVRHTDFSLKALIGFFIPQGMLGLVFSSPKVGLGPAHIYPVRHTDLLLKALIGFFIP
ncbi:hypothetical protein IG631_01477 [Alternaria alternata]|nr:hypothetical protein IG631_01477 [Alternaria alternata]